MKPGSLWKALLWSVLPVALVLKMILLEPLNLTIQGFRFVVVASLLPLALLMRWGGVAVIATACGMAHWLNHGDLTDAWIAAGSVGLATGSGLLILRSSLNIPRWIAAGWAVTAVLSLSMAAGQALFLGQAFSEALTVLVLGIWAPINVVGVPAALMLHRLGYWAPSVEAPPQGLVTGGNP